MAKLGDILSPAQITRVRKIVNKSKTFDECVAGLKKYFNEIKDSLEPQGIVPDYLAYAATHSFSLTMQEEAESGKASKKGNK